jgi:2-C-methyl-D-erythritol 4-phosphate cytidylyltransferase
MASLLCHLLSNQLTIIHSLKIMQASSSLGRHIIVGGHWLDQINETNPARCNHVILLCLPGELRKMSVRLAMAASSPESMMVSPLF